jgi:hypothetical protein
MVSQLPRWQITSGNLRFLWPLDNAFESAPNAEVFLTPRTANIPRGEPPVKK